MAKPRAKSGMKRAPAKRRPRKAKAGTRGLLPAESRLDSLPKDAQEARDRIESEGGFVVGAYNDPLGNNPLLVAVLPIARIEPGFRRQQAAGARFCLARPALRGRPLHSGFCPGFCHGAVV